MTKTGNDLFIVDNSDHDWKVLNYLKEWADISSCFDIATGYFEIGALLALDGQWQKLSNIRILMGDEVSRRTHRALLDGIARVKLLLEDSLAPAGTPQRPKHPHPHGARQPASRLVWHRLHPGKSGRKIPPTGRNYGTGRNNGICGTRQRASQP